MTTVFIARRGAQRARASQAQLEASRELKVLGVADTLYRAQAALPALDPDTLLIDLCLEDGSALSLVRGLRDRQAERPKVMLVAPDAADPLLFATLRAGADAYLLEADLPTAASALRRMVAGEAAMSAPIAAQVLQFFNEPLATGAARAAMLNERALDWHSHAANPMRLSPGECRLAQALAAGARSAELAARMSLSVEAIGRRIGNVYRKLSWDVRSGSLALLAA
jgi:DNA-binding NarL/FixJ family response regulator